MQKSFHFYVRVSWEDIGNYQGNLSELMRQGDVWSVIAHFLSGKIQSCKLLNNDRSFSYYLCLFSSWLLSTPVSADNFLYRLVWLRSYLYKTFSFLRSIEINLAQDINFKNLRELCCRSWGWVTERGQGHISCDVTKVGSLIGQCLISMWTKR